MKPVDLMLVRVQCIQQCSIDAGCFYFFLFRVAILGASPDASRIWDGHHSSRAKPIHSLTQHSFWIVAAVAVADTPNQNISTDVVVQRVLQVASVMILLSLFWMHSTNTRKVRHATLPMAWHTKCLVGMGCPFCAQELGEMIAYGACWLSH